MLTFANTLVTADSNMFSPVATPLLGHIVEKRIGTNNGLKSRLDRKYNYESIWNHCFVGIDRNLGNHN